MDDRIEKHLQICGLIRKFLKLLEHNLCGRCSGAGHHKGHMLHHICNGKSEISVSDIKKWISDPEHGLFHGMCTAIWTTFYFDVGIYNKKVEIRHSDNEKSALFLASSIFHDFARSMLGEKNHDITLKDYFDSLSEDVYTHVNPKKETPLIFADRFELTRFVDWHEWVNQEKLDSKLIPFLEVFNPIRECLRRFVAWEGPWMRHGIEARSSFLATSPATPRRYKLKESWKSSEVWPLLKSYMKREGGWAAETETDPVSQPCFYHGKGRFWKLCGLTTCSRVKDIRPFTSRDHLAGHRVLNIDEWVFYYESPLKDNGARDLIEAFIKRNLPILPWDIVKLWCRVWNKFIATFIALRGYKESQE